MDVATTGMRYMRKTGKLDRLDISDEVNACTVKTTIAVDGKDEDWLFLFKNETHNHPTEIEPFGGAATCVGGGIRDPLSGRSFVYQAMRVTGSADPTAAYDATLPGKLPQRTITQTAAEGNSSYGNQVGLAAGYLDEIYHPGYAAKRMEIGALVGAAKVENVVRLTPSTGDVVILLGGRTGRDGIGAATGSSRTQDTGSLESFGAEVQKGNAPEGRKLQRLFRNPEASRLIKRCNDFGAGGVSVAIGELADGLDIDLGAVPVKYPGLDGTEVAISESQERMAVVVAKADADAFISLASREAPEATQVAVVTEEPKLIMRWNGEKIVDIDRAFLGANGAAKHAKAKVARAAVVKDESREFVAGFHEMAKDLNCAGKRGIASRFCPSVGAGTLFMPYGGKYMASPAESMAAVFPVLGGETDAASVMAYGYDPFISQQSPYRGAYLAVVHSLSKLAAAGALTDETYLSFQEYFERLKDEPERWGKPLSALLGALDAQLDYGVAAVGGKDSMSGSFEDIDVPPTLVSFAVSVADKKRLMTPEFKSAGNAVSLLLPEYNGETGTPVKESVIGIWNTLREASENGSVKAVRTIGYAGAAEAVFKMALGNRVGLAIDETVPLDVLFGKHYGGFVVEWSGEPAGVPLGTTTAAFELTYKGETIDLFELQEINDGVLEDVFPTKDAAVFATPAPSVFVEKPGLPPRKYPAKPVAVIPVFPGTNGEFDLRRAAENAGIETNICVIRNLSAADMARSAKEFCSQLKLSTILLLAGGMSLGAEPDGAGKFIAAFLRLPEVKDCVEALVMGRGGLLFGVGEGFGALLKTGLLPYGEYTDPGSDMPALAVNSVGGFRSAMVDVMACTNASPWLTGVSEGEITTLPVASREGRLVLGGGMYEKLAQNAQIASRYVDRDGKPSMETDFNPFGSASAVEGLLSPCGKIFGRMGHCERNADGLYLNVDMKKSKSVFASAAEYFK